MDQQDINFATLDVETANNDSSSICQVGVAVFEGGRLVDSHSILVNPRAPFGIHQMRVHGITPEKVASADPWPMVAGEIRRLLNGRVVAAHSGFDKRALEAACVKHGIASIEARWLDTMHVLPRAWPDKFGGTLPRSLKDAAAFLNVRFQHHDALEDAKVCGLIVLRACAATGLTPEGWLRRCNQPIRAVA